MGTYLDLSLPLMIYLVLLYDYRRGSDRSEGKAILLKILGGLIYLGLALSIGFIVFYIFTGRIDFRLHNYQKTLNIFILIGYLIVTRFERRGT